MTNSVTDSSSNEPRVALERLDDELDRNDFATVLNLDPGRPPSLTIASKRCPLAEEVFADERFFWFAWAEPICPVDEPVTAAQKIARVLRAVPEPSHG